MGPIDPKADRKTGIFHVKNIFYEPKIKNKSLFKDGLRVAFDKLLVLMAVKKSFLTRQGVSGKYFAMIKLAVLTTVLIFSSMFSSAEDFPDSSLKSFRQTLAEMVEADTTNPPGNESRVVNIVAKRLKDAGIAYEISDFAPGRQNIVARLKGSGLKPLLLIAHIDVVTAATQNWTSSPHKVTEKDGFLVGRGVSDDLGMAVMELETFINLKKSGTKLKRDVILALTGDEESGGQGIQYLLEKKFSSVDAAVALNEGGGLVLDEDQKMKLVSLQLAEKNYQDFTVTAKGPTGHSSVPLEDNAIYRLSRALANFGHTHEPARLIPVTRSYFEARSHIEKGPLGKAMYSLSQAQGKLPADALKLIEKNPSDAATLRTTCVATLLSGGTRVNALPSEAKANINCRVLPDESEAKVLKRIEAALNDPNVEVKPVGNFGSAGPSPVASEVTEAVAKITEQIYPGIPVVPTMSGGATDSRYLRARGIFAYGIDPIAMTESDDRRAHGIDERIPIASLKPGLEYFRRLVDELSAEKVNN